MVIVTISGEPIPGHEFAYWLALKHRNDYMRIFRHTPWWQFLKKARRWRGWEHAMDRYHANGRDVMRVCK